ncbi:C40 family peptidase [Chengkuizengella marina]|nr:SH3 domain-containing C40 family peptidase [Chengkuizengella marina]
MKFNMKKKMISTVLAAALVLSIAPVQNLAFASEIQTAEVIWGVNFREAPSTSGEIIRMLKKGEDVQIISKVNDYWYEVKDKNGKVGYISANKKYTKPTNESGNNNELNLSEDTNSIADATIVRGVSFRTGPSTSYDRMRYLKTGEDVTIIEKVNKYWYKVLDKKGQAGYVSSSKKFIKLLSENNETSTPQNETDPDSNSNTDTNTDQGTEINSDAADQIIQAGMKYLGTPYEYGSNRNSTKTFDCSDFVRRTFIDALGVKLPYDSRQQADYVRDIGDTTTNWKNLQPGDLMFFMSYKGSKESSYSGINKSKQRITHVGIYIGDGKILHTYSKESGGVKVNNIENTHWEYRFVLGGSAIK